MRCHTILEQTRNASLIIAHVLMIAMEHAPGADGTMSEYAQTRVVSANEHGAITCDNVLDCRRERKDR